MFAITCERLHGRLEEDSCETSHGPPNIVVLFESRKISVTRVLTFSGIKLRISPFAARHFHIKKVIV